MENVIDYRCSENDSELFRAELLASILNLLKP